MTDLFAPTSSEATPKTAAPDNDRLAYSAAFSSSPLWFREKDYEIAVFRSPSRARPICSSSHTDFITRSRLIAGVSGHLLRYPARYSSEAVSMPSRAQTR